MRSVIIRLAKWLILLLCVNGWAGAQTDGTVFIQGRITTIANGLALTSDSDHSVLRIENPEIFRNPQDHHVVLHGFLNKDSIHAISAATIDNATDPLGNALLEMASYRKDADVVLHLLRLGANPNTRGLTGNSALMESLEGGIMRWGESPSLEISKLLLEQEADPNLPNDYGTTPLMLAAFAGNDDVVNLLLNHHARVNAKDKHGRSPLMYTHRSSVIRIFADAGASIEDQDNDGKTVLLYASGRGNYEVVKALLEIGANANAKDKDGKTALDMAKKRRDSFTDDSYRNRYQQVIDILMAAAK